MMATCNECKKDGEDEPFSVPWDAIGAELMKGHFADKHPEIRLPLTNDVRVR